MDYRLLARSPFLAANAYNFLFGAVTMGFYSFIPYYAVVKYGLTPFQSAAVLTPRAAVVTVTSMLASLYVKRLGYRVPMLLGMLFVGVTFVLMAQGWSSFQVGGVGLQGFWLLAVIIAIGGFPQQIDEVFRRKINQDAMAFLRSFTVRRGRNPELAEKAITESKAFTEKECLDGKMIDLIVNTSDDLIRELDGRTITRFDGTKVTLALQSAVLEPFELSARQR